MNTFTVPNSDNITFTHYQQDKPYGCLYYSYAILTGDTSLLKFEDDVSFIRFEIRLWRKGYMMFKYYSNQYESCSISFWEHFRDEYVDVTGYKPLMLCISSLIYENALHEVAAIINVNEDYVVVFDPLHESYQKMTFDDFLDCPYSRCYEVAGLSSNKLNHSKPIFGDSLLIKNGKIKQ